MKKFHKFFKNPYYRFLTITATIIFIVFSGYILNKYLFLENPYFNLNNIIVNSSGSDYWDNRSEKIADILNLKTGEVNLFQIDTERLRKILTNNMYLSIKRAEVYKIFPDTLKITIYPRIPAARLYNKNSDLIIDRVGILINKEYYNKLLKGLPVITGFKSSQIRISHTYNEDEIPYGRKIKPLKPALAFISLVKTDYPSFNIKKINLYYKNKLIAFMVGPLRKRIIKAILPFQYSRNHPIKKREFRNSNKLLKEKLKKLKKLYDYLRVRKKECSEINMLYKGQAVVK